MLRTIQTTTLKRIIIKSNLSILKNLEIQELIGLSTYYLKWLKYIIELMQFKQCMDLRI
jgi:hypothetical protein